MYNIAICDDSFTDTMRLQELILSNHKCPREIVIHRYSSGEELLSNMDLKFSLVFLDIQMPGIDGDKTAKVIRTRDDNLVLVFISGELYPSPENIKSKPFRYLIKQMSNKELGIEIADILKKMIENHKIPDVEGVVEGKNNKKILLKLKDVVYAERYKRKSRIYISLWAQQNYRIENEDIITINKKLEVLYKDWLSFGFACPHNSYVVNLYYVSGGSKCVLREVDKAINISRGKSQEFKRLKYLYIEGGISNDS